MQKFWEHLRNEFRLKLNVDYSYTFKYGELRILCGIHFKETIAEEAAKCGVAIHQFFTY